MDNLQGKVNWKKKNKTFFEMCTIQKHLQKLQYKPYS